MRIHLVHWGRVRNNYHVGQRPTPVCYDDQVNEQNES